MSEIKAYFCVDRYQMETNYYHANWMRIKATSRNKAKYEYSKRTKTKYIDCVAKLACYEKEND